MAVLPRTHIPPSRKVWGIVEMLKARHDMTDEQLAGAARNRTEEGGTP